MSKATETRIPCSQETRKRLNILKAEEEFKSSDELVDYLIDEYRD